LIQNWTELSSYEEKMIALIKEMTEEYYKAQSIDRMEGTIKLNEIFSSSETSLDFFRIGISSKIPFHYLDYDMPILGIEMIGRKIAVGENKALVDYVSENVCHKLLQEINFADILKDAYKTIGHIGVMFVPIKFFSKIYSELDVKFEDNCEYILTGSEKIKFIYSNKFSEWDNLVILGKNSIRWTRKKNPPLPPNLSDFAVCSEKDEYFQSAYKITHEEAQYIVSTVSNCQILNTDKVMVYSLPKESKGE